MFECELDLWKRKRRVRKGAGGVDESMLREIKKTRSMFRVEVVNGWYFNYC